MYNKYKLCRGNITDYFKIPRQGSLLKRLGVEEMLILKERRQNVCVVATSTDRTFPHAIRFPVFKSTSIPCFFINYNIFTLKKNKNNFP